jgi:hypothetical protein
MYNTIEKLNDLGIKDGIVTLEIYIHSKEECSKTWEILVNEKWIRIEAIHDEISGNVKLTAIKNMDSETDHERLKIRSESELDTPEKVEEYANEMIAKMKYRN